MYLRPFGEMNGHWNAYCAFTEERPCEAGPFHRDVQEGVRARLPDRPRRPGGRRERALRRLGLPPLARQRPAREPVADPEGDLESAGLRLPDIPANCAQAYYPGDKYVDVVGNDLYDIRGKAEWAANEALYKAHPGKPYAIPEWGLWGIDDPSFILQDGGVREDAQARRARLVLQQQRRVDLRSRDQAEEPRGVPEGDHAARVDRALGASRTRRTREASSTVVNGFGRKA